MQVGQNRQHPAVVGFALGDPELAEDVLHVLLYGPAGNEELLCYGLVGTALGHEGQYLSCGGKRRETFVAPPARQQLVHDLGIQHGTAGADGLERGDEFFYVGDAVFEKVARALGAALQ